MMQVRKTTLAVLILLMTLACGSAASGGSGLDANLIAREQIDEVGPSNAYNIIEALRPTWLQKRGPTSFYNEGEVRVYLDNSSLGGIEALRGIHSDNIESISFLDERRASFRFGPNHEQGVILVLTRR
ncbi:MAG: hypothetical protein HKO65_19715 [Gemmatimonadetes bacterium]|nr:hypothetical protein [Gemmatimonadota bacterium]NNM07331.1 hypothetical protein [Gemmatimonadota bacterium]